MEREVQLVYHKGFTESSLIHPIDSTKHVHVSRSFILFSLWLFKLNLNLRFNLTDIEKTVKLLL